jgi:hypothetical protein
MRPRIEWCQQHDDQCQEHFKTTPEKGTAVKLFKQLRRKQSVRCKPHRRFRAIRFEGLEPRTLMASICDSASVSENTHVESPEMEPGVSDLAGPALLGEAMGDDSQPGPASEGQCDFGGGIHAGRADLDAGTTPENTGNRLDPRAVDAAFSQYRGAGDGGFIPDEWRLADLFARQYEGPGSAVGKAIEADSWSTSQTFTLTGVDDCEPDDSVAYKIALGPASSTGPADDSVTGQCDGIGDGAVALEASGLIEPPARQHEGLEKAVGKAVEVNSWSTPQTVTLTNVDDLEPDGGVAYTIVLAPVASTDAAGVSVRSQYPGA